MTRSFYLSIFDENEIEEVERYFEMK